MFIYNTQGNVTTIEYTDYPTLSEYYAFYYLCQYGINISLRNRKYNDMKHIKELISNLIVNEDKKIH